MGGPHDAEPGPREEHCLEEGCKCEIQQTEVQVFQFYTNPTPEASQVSAIGQVGPGPEQCPWLVFGS